MSNKETISASNAREKYIERIQKVFDKKENLEPQEKVTAIDEVKKKWAMNDKIIELFVDNIGKDQKLRNKYAIILIVILGIELLALLTIFILQGAGVLNYKDSTLNIFISGGIAEIYVLIRVIVKYLFKDNLTETLKIIISTNNTNKTYRKENKKNRSIQEKQIWYDWQYML